MKILATADLHYDNPRSRAAVVELARQVRREAPDVLVLVGDTAGANLDCYAEALSLFGDLAGLKMLVPGNHCLWARPGQAVRIGVARGNLRAWVGLQARSAAGAGGV
jgi:predicted MPP superfamily phosphohydrolase